MSELAMPSRRLAKSPCEATMSRGSPVRRRRTRCSSELVADLVAMRVDLGTAAQVAALRDGRQLLAVVAA
jgi:hypothetical protein